MYRAVLYSCLTLVSSWRWMEGQIAGQHVQSTGHYYFIARPEIRFTPSRDLDEIYDRDILVALKIFLLIL